MTGDRVEWIPLRLLWLLEHLRCQKENIYIYLKGHHCSAYWCTLMLTPNINKSWTLQWKQSTLNTISAAFAQPPYSDYRNKVFRKSLLQVQSSWKIFFNDKPYYAVEILPYLVKNKRSMHLVLNIFQHFSSHNSKSTEEDWEFWERSFWFELSNLAAGESAFWVFIILVLVTGSHSGW